MAVLPRRGLRIGLIALAIVILVLFFLTATPDSIRPTLGSRPEEQIAKEHEKEQHSPEQLALHDALNKAEQAAKDKAALKDLERVAQKADSAESSGSASNEDAPKEPPSDEIIEFELNDLITKRPIVVFSKTHCPYSRKAKKVLGEYNFEPRPFIVELDVHPYGQYLLTKLGQKTQRTTVPNVLVNRVSIGGGDDLESMHEQGKLAARIQEIAGDLITIS